MSLSFRQSDILELARTERRVTVDGLATHFDVTAQTIRRDLSDLAEAGLLDRVHGGAVLPSSLSNIGYEDRRSLHEDAKTRIAQTCAADIPDGASVFLNIGTSTEAVARELLRHRNLMVVTNNLNVAHILMANEACEIILAGGVLRRLDGGLIDRDGDLLDFDFQEVGVSQTIIAQARKTYLVADHSKFQRRAPARITSLSAVHSFYTDQPLPSDLARHCKKWNTRVVLTT